VEHERLNACSSLVAAANFCLIVIVIFLFFAAGKWSTNGFDACSSLVAAVKFTFLLLFLLFCFLQASGARMPQRLQLASGRREIYFT
jgi:hypothetical protein